MIRKLKITLTDEMKEFLRQQIMIKDFELKLMLKKRRRKLEIEIERIDDRLQQMLN